MGMGKIAAFRQAMPGLGIPAVSVQNEVVGAAFWVGGRRRLFFLWFIVRFVVRTVVRDVRNLGLKLFRTSALAVQLATYAGVL